jgi:hypothetical protein
MGVWLDENGNEVGEGARKPAPAAAAAPADNSVGLAKTMDSGKFGSIRRALTEGMTWGVGAPITGTLSALALKAKAALNPDDPYLQQFRDKSFPQLAYEGMEREHAGNTKSEAENPGLYKAVRLAGGVATGLGGARAVPAFISKSLPAGASVGSRIGAGVLDSQIMSGALGAAQDPSLESVNRAMWDPTNLVGGAIPALQGYGPTAASAAKEYVKQGIGTVARKVLPKVTPTPEAKALMDQGVELTVGRMNPDTTVGQLEEKAAQQNMGGTRIRKMREQADSQYFHNEIDNVAKQISRSTPEGGNYEPPAPGRPWQRHSAIRDMFSTEYTALGKGHQVYPAIHANGNGMPLQGTANTPGAFDEIFQIKGILPSAKEVAKQYIDDGLGLLKGGTVRPGVVSKVDASDIMEQRSFYREQAHKHRTGDTAVDGDIARLMDAAADKLTATLESQLPPEAVAKDRELSKAYSDFMTTRLASGRSGLEGEATPTKVGAAIRSRVGEKAWELGAGGDIRRRAEAAERVLAPRTVPTGSLLADYLPQWGVSVLGNAVNTEPVKAALLRKPMVPGRVAPPNMTPVKPRTAGFVRAMTALEANSQDQGAEMTDADRDRLERELGLK